MNETSSEPTPTPMPEKWAWVKPGVLVWYHPTVGGTERYAGVADSEPWQLGGTRGTWVVHLHSMEARYRNGTRTTVPAAALDALEPREDDAPSCCEACGSDPTHVVAGKSCYACGTVGTAPVPAAGEGDACGEYLTCAGCGAMTSLTLPIRDGGSRAVVAEVVAAVLCSGWSGQFNIEHTAVLLTCSEPCRARVEERLENDGALLAHDLLDDELVARDDARWCAACATDIDDCICEPEAE